MLYTKNTVHHQTKDEQYTKQHRLVKSTGRFGSGPTAGDLEQLPRLGINSMFNSQPL
jgi:hypothetical protein